MQYYMKVDIMITLKQFLELISYKITESTEFQWECYGNNARSIDSWDGNQNGHSLSIIFDTMDQTVYEVQAHDYKNNRAYRVINPDFVNALPEAVEPIDLQPRTMNMIDSVAKDDAA